MSKNIVIVVLALLLSVATGFCVYSHKINRELKTQNEEFEFAFEANGNLFKMACQYGKQIEKELADLKLAYRVMHTGYHEILYPKEIYTAVDAKTGEVEVLDTAPPSDHPLIRVSPGVIRSAPKVKTT